MLPGCLLAGIGLGLTNTPVTNTTTGSVPANRAGMASGIDMSARLITLAINDGADMGMGAAELFGNVDAVIVGQAGIDDGDVGVVDPVQELNKAAGFRHAMPLALEKVGDLVTQIVFLLQ
jgi:hypothetical protein